MSKSIRNLRNLAPYLLPVSLLMISGVLLMGLLYYPAPLVQGSARHIETTAITEQKYWRSLADSLLAALMADAMQQLRIEQQTQAQTPRYPEIHPGELNASLRIAPLIIENSGDSHRPTLISL